jgi:hypothetical protein
MSAGSSLLHPESSMAKATKQQGGEGNFANDPEKAREAGKKGGQHAHQGSTEPGQQSRSGGHSSSEQPSSGEHGSGGHQRGGSGNFANDPERASEAGRKGGEHSHGGDK